MAEVDDWALPGTAAPSSGGADDWALPGASAPQAHGIFHHEPPAPGQGFWSYAAQGIPETLSNAGKFVGAVGSGLYHGAKDVYDTASALGSGQIDPSTPEGSLQAANVAASVLPMSPAMRTGSAIARAATPAAGPAIASRAGENAVASALDLGPQVATPRPNLDINLLPPETPHTPTGRASVGAASSSSDPLAGYSPETIASMRGLMENEGLTPYTLDQRLEEMSQHDFLGELSPNTSLSMSGLASKSPARNEIVNSVKQRALEAKDRMSSTFDDAFGEGENMAQLAQITKLDRDKQAAPFYRQFRNTEIPPTPEISALLPRLEAAGALRAANKSLAVEGLPSSIGFGETDLAGNLANEQRIPTASAFQYAKEHLDKLIEQSLASPGGANDARRYTTLKNALVDAIDNHPDPNVAGIWKQARDTYAGPTQTLKAASFGKQLMTGNVNAEELPFMTSSYSPSEMRALRIGVRSYLEDIAGRPGKTDLRVINQVLAPNNQSKLRWILGDEQADRLIGAIEHEQRMHHAPSSLIYNSMTQPRTEAAKFWDAPAGAPAPLGSDLTLTDIGHTVNHVPGKLLSGAANVVLARRAAAHAAKVAKVQEESARMMTLQGAERDAVLRSLINTPAQQNVYSMGRGFAHGGAVNPQNINHAPTEAQKKAGNYAKDHLQVHGLDITIENARGAKRSGVDKGGKPWSVRMPSAYGYIKKTEGADGDHVDVYLGPHIKSPKVFIIDQIKDDTRSFDEHKCFIGFPSKSAVIATYHKAFSDGKGPDRFGHITEMPIDQFKQWLDSGDTKKPLRYEKAAA